jgi:hypothetical protein
MDCVTECSSLKQDDIVISVIRQELKYRGILISGRIRRGAFLRGTAESRKGETGAGPTNSRLAHSSEGRARFFRNLEQLPVDVRVQVLL